MEQEQSYRSRARRRQSPGSLARTAEDLLSPIRTQSQPFLNVPGAVIRERETRVGLVAHLSESSGAEQRRTARRTLRLQVAGTISDGVAAPMIIHDLSATGLLVQTDDGPPVGEKLHIELLDAGRHPAKVVWSSGQFIGCRFDRPLPQAVISAALLRSAPAEVEQRIEAPGASSAVQQLQARVHHLVNGPVGIDAVEAESGQQAGLSEDRLPLHVRGRVLLGLGAASAGVWALVLWGMRLI